jgi:hypothetical protein
MTIEAQSASFNFANTLICAVGSSARRAVPAAIKTSPFPNALLGPHGTDRQLHMPAVGKFEVARNNMPGTALDDESGAVREPAGKTIGWAHHNLLKDASLEKSDALEIPRCRDGSGSGRNEVPISVSCCGYPLQRPISLGNCLGSKPRFRVRRSDVYVYRPAACRRDRATKWRAIRLKSFGLEMGFLQSAQRAVQHADRSRNPLQFLRFSDRVDRTEDGMPQTCYSVEQFQSEWVVSVCGSRVLTFKTKRMALRAARRATVLLHRSQRAEFPGHEASSAGSDEPFGRAGMVFRGP